MRCLLLQSQIGLEHVLQSLLLLVTHLNFLLNLTNSYFIFNQMLYCFPCCIVFSLPIQKRRSVVAARHGFECFETLFDVWISHRKQALDTVLSRSQLTVIYSFEPGGALQLLLSQFVSNLFVFGIQVLVESLFFLNHLFVFFLFQELFNRVLLDGRHINNIKIARLGLLEYVSGLAFLALKLILTATSRLLQNELGSFLIADLLHFMHH